MQGVKRQVPAPGFSSLVPVQGVKSQLSVLRVKSQGPGINVPSFLVNVFRRCYIKNCTSFAISLLIP